MRVIERGERWCVQFGFYRQRGSTKRFMTLAEWPADDLRQAHAIVAREGINLALSPLPADAKPIEARHTVTRTIRETPQDIEGLLRMAREGLTDPLPTTAESHRQLTAAAPLEKAGGRQFYAYLREPVYQRLAAMAVAAGTTRNRILEALLLDQEAE